MLKTLSLFDRLGTSKQKWTDEEERALRAGVEKSELLPAKTCSVQLRSYTTLSAFRIATTGVLHVKVLW